MLHSLDAVIGQLSYLQIGLIIGTMVLAGFVRGFVGFGASLIIVMVLSLVLEPLLAVPISKRHSFFREILCPSLWRGRIRCCTGWRGCSCFARCYNHENDHFGLRPRYGRLNVSALATLQKSGIMGLFERWRYLGFIAGRGRRWWTACGRGCFVPARCTAATKSQRHRRSHRTVNVCFITGMVLWSIYK